MRGLRGGGVRSRGQLLLLFRIGEIESGAKGETLGLRPSVV